MRRVLATLLERAAAGRIEHDPEWPSPCEVGEPDPDGMIRWRPVGMMPPPDFRDVEAEAGVILHPDAKEFYGSYFGRTAELHFRGSTVLLRTIWNQQELALCKRNIVEHLRLCPTIPGPLSVFIAHTDGDPFYSVHNTTGEIFLEEPDWPRSVVVAPNLTSFLSEPR